MRVNIDRCCEAATAGYAAIAAHVDAANTDDARTILNERIVAVAVLALSTAESLGLSLEAFLDLAMKVAEEATRAERLQ